MMHYCFTWVKVYFVTMNKSVTRQESLIIHFQSNICDNLIYFCIAALYEPTGEHLGEGSFGSVLSYKNVLSGKEYAVKVSISHL